VYPPPPRVQQLEAENAALKAELERAAMRVSVAERTIRQRAGQELALRESILSVRREVRWFCAAWNVLLILLCRPNEPCQRQLLLSGALALQASRLLALKPSFSLQV
jgi:hypothetical protein